MTAAQAGRFARSRERLDAIAGWLSGAAAAGLTHGELEEQLESRGRELLRQVYQDYLDLRAAAETRLPAVAGADGAARTRAEAGHARALATVFGTVTVSRIAYRSPGHPNLHPADAALNLPAGRHSHGLRRLAAAESARGSYQAAAAAVSRHTGQRAGKRQIEELAALAAADFVGFYTARRPPPAADPGHILVLSADAKGVIMRRGHLRPRAAADAAKATRKQATRLSRGEVRCHKRMATVGAVYDTAPVSRTPADIMPAPGQQPRPARAAPRAAAKWLTVTITNDTAAVISGIFAEAHRRDPGRQRPWIALVDGNPHQIAALQAQAAASRADVTIIVDFIHVLEYLWNAAWCFHPEADPAADHWVRARALAILSGHAAAVAADITRQAAATPISAAKRKTAHRTASYLATKAPYLDYPAALANGWPIATGVIEGACRHLIKDRMDITGARWTTPGAETILQLRALHANGDFDAYWTYHLDQERRRHHQTRYLNGAIPRAA